MIVSIPEYVHIGESTRKDSREELTIDINVILNKLIYWFNINKLK